MARRKKSATGVKLNLANVGKSFPPDAEVMVKCVECSLEEGDAAPYFKLKLEGVEDYAGAIMYHNASTAEKALWRLRPMVEAFGVEIPDDEFELEADDFVGKYAMCSTFKDRKPDGGFSIKPEDFWEAEETPEGDGAEGGDPVEFDIEELEDDDIKALAKEMGLKGRGVAALKKKIEAADEEDILEAAESCGLLDSDSGGGEEGSDEVDLDELEDDQIKAVAKAAGIKGRVVKKLKAALEELEEDELAEALEEAGITGEDAGGDAPETVTEEDINGMDQDQLENLVDAHELDVDLDDFKTLRKKRVAVIDAAEEAEILEE